MSDRLDSFRAALVRHCGKRTAEKAGPILLDLLRDYYALVHLGELTEDQRRAGLIVRIAAELEREADTTRRGRAEQSAYADEVRTAAHTPYPTR